MSSAFCNKILFFSNKEIVFDDLLLNLEKYMMTMKNCQHHISIGEVEKAEKPDKPDKPDKPNKSIVDVSISPVVTEVRNSKPDPRSERDVANPFILPYHRDTLFWCLYIAHYGYADYTVIERNSGMRELTVKSTVAEFIKANPTALKSTNYKITKVAAQEILSDLLTTQNETSMQCMLAIMTCFKFNVIMIDDKESRRLEFWCNQDRDGDGDTTEGKPATPTFLIKRNPKGKYQIKSDPLSVDEITAIQTTTICLESYMKPIKAISAYKVADLDDLARRMGLDTSQKKYKKNELYTLIENTLQWT